MRRVLIDGSIVAAVVGAALGAFRWLGTLAVTASEFNAWLTVALGVMTAFLGWVFGRLPEFRKQWLAANDQTLTGKYAEAVESIKFKDERIKELFHEIVSLRETVDHKDKINAGLMREIDRLREQQSRVIDTARILAEKVEPKPASPPDPQA